MIRCDFCHELVDETEDKRIHGFVVERNGRRLICLHCARAIYKAVVDRILEKWQWP